MNSSESSILNLKALIKKVNSNLIKNLSFIEVILDRKILLKKFFQDR